MKKILTLFMLVITMLTFTACVNKKINITVENNELKIKADTLITKLDKPTNNKKAFDKWLVNGKEVNDNYKLQDGDKLTASWRDFKFYKVVFENTLTPIQEQIIREDKKVVKPNTPTKKYYEFKGWYDGDNLFEFDNFITKDITLTAKWESIEAPKTKVKLDINGIIKDFQGYYASDLPTNIEDTDTGYFTHWTINDNKVDSSYELKDGDKFTAVYGKFTRLLYNAYKKEIITDNVDLLGGSSVTHDYFLKKITEKYLKIRNDKELKPKDYINFIPKLDGYKIICVFKYRTNKIYNEEKINGILCTTIPPVADWVQIMVVKE